MIMEPEVAPLPESYLKVKALTPAEAGVREADDPPGFPPYRNDGELKGICENTVLNQG